MTVDPLQGAMSQRLPAAEFIHKSGPALADEVASDVGSAFVHARATFTLCCSFNGAQGNLFLCAATAPCESLDSPAIAVTRLEIHPGIHPSRIRTQRAFHMAELFNDLSPVHQGQLS